MDVKTQSLTDPLSPAYREPLRERGGANTGGRQSRGSFVWFLVRLLVIVLAFRTLVFAPFSIPSESMLPQLMNGDYLLAAKWPYGISRYSLPFDLPLPSGRIMAGTPARGDVVIVKHPVDRRDYIKRVIALPGDRVAVIGGQIVLNGQPVPRVQVADFIIPLSANTGCEWGGDVTRGNDGRDACRYTRFRETLPGGRSYHVLDFGLTQGDSFAAVTVPAGALFLMGDNRDNSRDSRFAAVAGDAIGLVPQDLLVARASIIIWSTDGSAEWLAPWTWFSAARGNRIGGGL